MLAGCVTAQERAAPEAALQSQQDMQAPAAEASPHMGQTSQPCPQFCVVGPVAPISHFIRTQPIVLHARRSPQAPSFRRAGRLSGRSRAQSARLASRRDVPCGGCWRASLPQAAQNKSSRANRRRCRTAAAGCMADHRRALRGQQRRPSCGGQPSLILIRLARRNVSWALRCRCNRIRHEFSSA
jgi:hypothetical protein